MRRVQSTVLVIVSVLAMAATAASASPTWEVVVAGGLNVTNLYGNDTSGDITFDVPTVGVTTFKGNIDNYDVGFATGALLNLYLTDRVGLQSGLMFDRKGGKGKASLQAGGLGTISADIDVTLDYMEIPLALLVKIPAGTSVDFHVLGGGVVSFNTNAEISASAYGASESADIGDYTKNVDFGVLLGAGLSIPVQRVALVLDARWTLGLTKAGDILGQSLDIKNNAFSFLFGVGVPLGYRP